MSKVAEAKKKWADVMDFFGLESSGNFVKDLERIGMPACLTNLSSSLIHLSSLEGSNEQACLHLHVQAV